MSEEVNQRAEGRRKRGCLFHAAITAAVAALACGALAVPAVHLPIAEAVAKRLLDGKIGTLDFSLDGSLLGDLRIRDMTLQPGAGNSGALEQLRVREAGVKYSLMDILTGGPAPIEKVTLKDAVITIGAQERGKPAKPKTPESPSTPRTLDWLRYLPTEADVQNVDIRIRRHDASDTSMEIVALQIPKQGMGRLDVAKIELPGGWKKHNLQAGIRVDGEGGVLLENLEIADGFVVRRAALTTQTIPDNVLGVALSVRLGKGAAEAVGAVAWGGENGLFTVAAAHAHGIDAKTLQQTIPASNNIKGTLDSLTLNLQGYPERPASLAGSATLRASGVATGPLAPLNIHLAASTENGTATLAPLVLERDGQGIVAHGKVDWLGTDDRHHIPHDLAVDIHAEEVASFWNDNAPLSGGVSGRMLLTRQSGPQTADVALQARNLRVEAAHVATTSLAGRLSLASYEHPARLTGSLTLHARQATWNGEYRIDEFSASLERTQTDAAVQAVALANTGENSLALKATLEDPATPDWNSLHVQGTVEAPRLEAFAATNSAPPLSGHAEAVFAFNGVQPLPSGWAQILTRKLSVGEISGVAVRARTEFSPQRLHLDIKEASSSGNDLSARLTAVDRRMEIETLRLRVDGNTALEASGNIPFPFPPSDTPFDENAALALKVKSQSITFAELMQTFGADGAPGGRFRIDGSLEGTLGRPSGHFEFEVADLVELRGRQIDPVRIAFDTVFQEGTIHLDGTLEQELISPLTLQGEVRLDPVKVMEQRRIPENTAFSLRANLPETALGVVKPFVPVISSLEGSLSGGFLATGTLASPKFSGRLAARIPQLAFSEPAYPNVRNADIAVSLADRTVAIEKFEALIAGGDIQVAGNVVLPEKNSPAILNLQLETSEALLYRNDSILLRANASLSLNGPLNKADLSGRIALTDSRFFKDIDFLPLNLPGSAPPAPPASSFELSLKDTPLADWTFDVALTTDDPFLIRGNVASGHAVMDVRIAGSGVAPDFSGYIYSGDITLTLPYSKLQIQRATATLRPDQPLNPLIDIHGQTEMRNRNIDAYIFGPLRNMETVLLSQPPLPKEDILTLLATGVTREELENNPQILAGRASGLFLRKLLGWISPQGSSHDGDFIDRIEVSPGMVDPQSGEREISGSFRISDHFSLQGELGTENRYRFGIQYSIRFR